MLFSLNIFTDIALGVDIRTFRVRGLRKVARHTASPTEHAIPACCAWPGRQSAPKSNPTAAPALGQPGAISCSRRYPSRGPRIRAGHPLPGVFPWPTRGWVPLARSRPGMGPSGGKHVLPTGRPDLSRVKCHHVLADSVGNILNLLT
jgi:hypothetical protein